MTNFSVQVVGAQKGKQYGVIKNMKNKIFDIL